jgi:two-component system sensor histidine kinase RegB
MASVGMSSLLTRARGGVLLAGTRPPSEETADRWLIRLRWVAIMGMLATTLVGYHLVPALPIGRLLIVIGGIAAINVAWMAWVMRGVPRPAHTVVPQIVVDVISLAAVLWVSGGVDNPFAVFITFQIVLAGLLCSAPVTLGVTGLTMIAVGVISFAPPMPMDSAPMGGARVDHMGELMAVAALSAFSGFFVYVFVQRLQDLRRESARNEKLAMLGRLVGGMSHELNTPLATILLASKDLAHIGAEAGNDEMATLSRTIADEAQRAADIIDLMRGQVRPGQLNETIDLSAFVAEETERELSRLGFRGEKTVRTPGAVPHPVLKAGLSQVLKNVLKNAVEATSGVQAPRIEVSVSLVERGRSVDVTVVDNGPGIDASLLDRLGEPFQTTKEGAGGMGLGLYVSSVLAERMGGALHVDVLDGGGTRVTLSLPR